MVYVKTKFKVARRNLNWSENRDSFFGIISSCLKFKAFDQQHWHTCIYNVYKNFSNKSIVCLSETRANKTAAVQNCPFCILFLSDKT